jgi:hypothetical protein
MHCAGYKPRAGKNGHSAHAEPYRVSLNTAMAAVGNWLATTAQDGILPHNCCHSIMRSSTGFQAKLRAP